MYRVGVVNSSSIRRFVSCTVRVSFVQLSRTCRVMYVRSQAHASQLGKALFEELARQPSSCSPSPPNTLGVPSVIRHWGSCARSAKRHVQAQRLPLEIADRVRSVHVTKFKQTSNHTKRNQMGTRHRLHKLSNSEERNQFALLPSGPHRSDTADVSISPGRMRGE